MEFNEELFEELKPKVKELLKESRWSHTLGVVDVAEDLALMNNVDPWKAKIAALLHDCAKNLSDEVQTKFLDDNNIDISYLDDYQKVVHSHVGAHYIKIVFGIDDEEVINAIKYHTTGRPNMTMLEKIVFLADFLDPGRDYEHYAKTFFTARKYAYRNIDEAMQFVLSKLIVDLNRRGKPIYKDTFDANEYYSKFDFPKKSNKRMIWNIILLVVSVAIIVAGLIYLKLTFAPDMIIPSN